MRPATMERPWRAVRAWRQQRRRALASAPVGEALRLRAASAGSRRPAGVAGGSTLAATTPRSRTSTVTRGTGGAALGAREPASAPAPGSAEPARRPPCASAWPAWATPTSAPGSQPAPAHPRRTPAPALAAPRRPPATWRRRDTRRPSPARTPPRRTPPATPIGRRRSSRDRGAGRGGNPRNQPDLGNRDHRVGGRHVRHPHVLRDHGRRDRRRVGQWRSGQGRRLHRHDQRERATRGAPVATVAEPRLDAARLEPERFVADDLGAGRLAERSFDGRRLEARGLRVAVVETNDAERGDVVVGGRPDETRLPERAERARRCRGTTGALLRPDVQYST